ncbi:MAG: class I SAM-dependent methyltransferase [Anaerolineae bacterium]
MTQATIDPDAFRQFEADGWGKVADAYHRFFGQITSRVIESLLDAARVRSGMRVLDLATGPGYAAARAAARGASVVGVDIASEMVSLHPGVEFRQADAEQPPFADRSFDALVGNFAILHFGRPEAAVAEFTRLLVPGGYLALSMWDGPERARILGVVFDAVQEAGAILPADVPPGPPVFRFSSDEEFSGLLRSAGLEGIEVRAVAFTHRLSSPDQLWNAVLSGSVRTAATIVGQTEETQRRIRSAFDRLMREYSVADGLEVPVSVKIASGQKPRLAA